MPCRPPDGATAPGFLSCTMAHAASRTARPRAQASESAGPSGRSGEMAAARHRGPARNNRIAGLGPSFLACPVSTLAGFAPSTLFDRSSPQGDLCSGCGLARRQLGVSARHEHGLARTTGLRTPIRPCETRAKDAAPFPPSVSSRSGSGPQHLQCVT